MLVSGSYQKLGTNSVPPPPRVSGMKGVRNLLAINKIHEQLATPGTSIVGWPSIPSHLGEHRRSLENAELLLCSGDDMKCTAIR